MPKESELLQAIVRKMQLQMADMQFRQSLVQRNISALQQTTRQIGAVQSTQPPAPSVNQMWNGELGHSVNTWNDTTLVATDKAKECAWWFSFCRPFSPKVFTTITTNNQIPLTAHNIEDGTFVTLITSGTLPSGGASPPTAGVGYYSFAVNANNIRLATTRALALAGTPDVTFDAGTGTGSHTLQYNLDLTDARTSSTNHALKNSSHTAYRSTETDWDSLRGIGRLTGTRPIAHVLPNNFIEPGITSYVRFILARRKAYIDIPATARLFVGLFDNTSGQADWLKGSVGFDASITGSAPSGTVERRYRIYVETDRGYTILSPEVTLVSAPDNVSFNNGSAVTLAWRRLVGVRNVQIWRYTPSTGVFALLTETSSGTRTYIDNNTTVRTDAGYPAGSETERKALFYTRTSELENLSIDGGTWNTMNAVVYCPDNYDRGNTTNRQWVVIGLTEAPDMRVTGIVTDGSTTITAPAISFESAYNSLYNAGTLVAKVYDSAGTLITTTTVASRTDDTRLVLGAAVAAGTDRVLRVVGGGFHGLLVDKIHLGFQPNTSFAPNPLDARVLQPVAAPSSGQGGVGTGDDPGDPPNDGGIICVVADTPIHLVDCTVPAACLEEGLQVSGENMLPNEVVRVHSGYEYARVVRTVNGFEKECTESHRFCTGLFDTKGAPLCGLRVGDVVMTCVDGRDELSPISYIGPRSHAKKLVIMPSLKRGRYYIAGQFIPKWWQRPLIAARVLRPKRGGIYAHNRKILI